MSQANIYHFMMMIMMTKEYDDDGDEVDVNVKINCSMVIMNTKPRLEDMYPAPNVALSWTVK